ncbi:MAG: hypothetical protein IJW30_02320 [Clostridia bacterium]|nr:hypothetical protein [Clostridia bacterium]
MKKSFGLYALGWLAALGLFNVITFVTPAEIAGESKFDTLFWVAYALITLLFVGQLVCSYFVFRAGSLQKTFYNISLFKVSVTSLISMLIVGGICMCVIPIPEWVGMIACSIVLTVNIIAAAKATVAGGAVSEIDQKIKEKTLFVKMLTADAQTLLAGVEDEEMRNVVKPVYEAIRYSDPMSNAALGTVENRIATQFCAFSAEVKANQLENAQALAKELLAGIDERNAKCKILK